MIWYEKTRPKLREILGGGGDDKRGEQVANSTGDDSVYNSLVLTAPAASTTSMPTQASSQTKRYHPQQSQGAMANKKISHGEN